MTAKERAALGGVRWKGHGVCRRGDCTNKLTGHQTKWCSECKPIVMATIAPRVFRRIDDEAELEAIEDTRSAERFRDRRPARF